jgi:hypothetical protein
MELLEKKSIMYISANTLFIFPALLTAVNVILIPDILFLLYFPYFLMSIGMLLHFAAVFVIAIVSVRASYKTNEKRFRVTLIILSISNVVLNIISWLSFFSYAMSIK